ncbi:MAG TPA: general stress protein CsbD [Prolixibacteraceae bacterium]|nr:general stress protein CsbD [Prolixibacteraceae bacterium]
METMVMGYWDRKKEKIKQKFPGITDQDLHFYEGKEKEMIENLEYKLGITKLELAKIIEAL